MRRGGAKILGMQLFGHPRTDSEDGVVCPDVEVSVDEVGAPGRVGVLKSRRYGPPGKMIQLRPDDEVSDGEDRNDDEDRFVARPRIEGEKKEDDGDASQGSI